MKPNIDLTIPFHSRFWCEVDDLQQGSGTAGADARQPSSPSCERGVGELDAHSEGPPMHGHGDQDEEFEIISGELLFTAGGKKQVARPGDVVSVPRGVPHTYKNDGDAICRFRYKLAPAGRFHEMMRTFEALVQQGKLKSTSDLRSIVHMSLVFGAFRDHVYGVVPPQVAMNIIGGIGRLFGANIEAAMASARSK